MFESGFDRLSGQDVDVVQIASLFENGNGGIEMGGERKSFLNLT